ncbi:hypothetical protein G6F22_018190 [Rhizopus arrhizus]|nr:hypothetical protein G6F22_018190 [Rhizopus arrhizus]
MATSVGSASTRAMPLNREKPDAAEARLEGTRLLVALQGPLPPALQLMPASFMTDRDTSTTFTSTCTTPPVPAEDTSTTFLSPPTADAAIRVEAICPIGVSAWPDTTARSPAMSTLAPPAMPRVANAPCTLPPTRRFQICGAALLPTRIDPARFPEAGKPFTSATSGSPIAMRAGTAPSSSSGCCPFTAKARSRAGAGAFAPGAAFCARTAAP